MKTIRSLCAALAVASLGGCGHVPLTSIPQLMKIDFASTDLGALRAAIQVPDTVKPKPGSIQLVVTVEPAGGGRHERRIPLSEDVSELPSLREEARRSRSLHAYRVPAQDLPRLEAFRGEMLALKKASGGKMSLSLGIDADACHLGAKAPDHVPVSSYIRTAETNGWVPVVRDMDLKEIAALAERDATLQPCEGAVSAPRAGS